MDCWRYYDLIMMLFRILSLTINFRNAYGFRLEILCSARCTQNVYKMLEDIVGFFVLRLVARDLFVNILTEFPPKCSYYLAPHAAECIQSIWFREGCTVHGVIFPRNDTAVIKANLDGDNLRFVTGVLTWY